MVHIFMATYNGERFLGPQIDSILAQTVTDWRLYIRDDCSKDGTRAVIRQYAERYPEKIVFVPSEWPSGGAMENFFTLMREYAALSGYFMFSDQDDIWLPEKIERSLAGMCRLEKTYGLEKPLLIHTDLSVADAKLNILEPSFERFQKLEYERNSLSALLQQNNITGCTMLFNRPLLELSLVEDTGGILMHDWWMGLVAAAFGAVGTVPEPTILYRQHGGNEVGAKNVKSPAYLLAQCRKFFGNENRFAKTHAQAARFLREYETRLTESQKELVNAFLSLPSASGRRRLSLVRRYGFSCQGKMRRLAQRAAYLITPRAKNK